MFFHICTFRYRQIHFYFAIYIYMYIYIYIKRERGRGKRLKSLRKKTDNRSIFSSLHFSYWKTYQSDFTSCFPIFNVVLNSKFTYIYIYIYIYIWDRLTNRKRKRKNRQSEGTYMSVKKLNKDKFKLTAIKQNTFVSVNIYIIIEKLVIIL